MESKVIKDSIELADFLNSKKAENIVVMEMSKINIADVFVLANSTSFVHSKVLEDYAEEFLVLKGYKRLNRQNIFPENPWILLDFGEIIVHIFVKDARDYYNIEKLWYDSKRVYEVKNDSKV